MLIPIAWLIRANTLVEKNAFNYLKTTFICKCRNRWSRLPEIVGPNLTKAENILKIFIFKKILTWRRKSIPEIWIFNQLLDWFELVQMRLINIILFNLAIYMLLNLVFVT